MNVTLTLEDDVVSQVLRIAAERDTTLSGLVRDYLTELARDSDADRSARSLANMERAFELFSLDTTPRTWTRSDLYERR